MKIISYNLRYGGSVGKDNHWQELIRNFTPDIVCAQESLHPDQYLTPDELSQFDGRVHSFVHHGKWGSAILSRNFQLEEIHLPGYEGWVVGARIPELVIGGVPQSVLVFSIHASSPGPYEPTVSRILDEIAKNWDKTPIIIAGDFNLTTAIRHPTEELGNSAREINILERLRREFGLFNAWQVLHPNQNLPQTLRWAKNPLPPYHCDAVFVSAIHLVHLESAKVDTSGIWGEMSDHYPIVVTLS
jgi:endonuclease/exonuclease/phosphatase family metal-dependent hydrolase